VVSVIILFPFSNNLLIVLLNYPEVKLELLYSI